MVVGTLRHGGRDRHPTTPQSSSVCRVLLYTSSSTPNNPTAVAVPILQMTKLKEKCSFSHTS